MGKRNNKKQTTAMNQPVAKEEVEDMEDMEEEGPTPPKAPKCNFWGMEIDDKATSSVDGHPSTCVSKLLIGQSDQNLKLRVINLGPLAKSNSGLHYLKFCGQDNSGAIDCMCFGEDAVQITKILKIRVCISMSSYVVRPSNIDTSVKEITVKVSALSLIDDDESLPDLDYDLKSIAHVGCASDNCVLDFLGIIVQIDEMKEGVSQVGKPFKLRKVHLTDGSQVCMPITIWGPAAEFCELKLYEPIAILKGQVKIFQNEQSVSCGFDTVIWINPDLPEVGVLQQSFMQACKKQGILVKQ